MKTNSIFKALSKTRYLAVLMLVMFAYTQAWGADPTKTFTKTHINASSTSSTQTPITLSIGGTVTVSGDQFRFSDAMTVEASGVYRIKGLAVSTNSTEVYISPLGHTVSSGTWSGSGTSYSWSGDAKSVTLTPNSGIRITQVVVTYYEVTAKYTVSFNAGSGTCATASLKEASACAGVTLPTAAPSDGSASHGWVFAGWKQTSAVSTGTTTAPKLYAAGEKYYPAADETLYAVYKLGKERKNCTAGKINATAGLAVDDHVIMVYETATKQFTGVRSSLGTVTSYETSPAETHVLTVKAGSTSGKFAFYDETDELYLSYSGSSNELKSEADVTASSSWTVTITSGAASITNVNTATRLLKYNPNNGNPRFACYTSSATGVYDVQLYKICPPIYTYISNCTFDYFVDKMHANETTTQQGTYSMPAALSDADKGDDYCAEKHYHFVGWLSEAYVNADGTLKSGYESYLYEPGHSGHTANNTTYYAIWAE